MFKIRADDIDGQVVLEYNDELIFLQSYDLEELGQLMIDFYQKKVVDVPSEDVDPLADDIYFEATQTAIELEKEAGNGQD